MTLGTTKTYYWQDIRGNPFLYPISQNQFKKGEIKVIKTLIKGMPTSQNTEHYQFFFDREYVLKSIEYRILKDLATRNIAETFEPIWLAYMNKFSVNLETIAIDGEIWIKAKDIGLKLEK